MKKGMRVLCLAILAALSLVVVSADASAEMKSSMGEKAKYQITFVPTWNPATHPLEYPISHAKGGLLTPMIGATHGPDYRIFAEGMPPTPGLENLSEKGMHSPLDSEIKKAVASGKAGSLIELMEGSAGPVHKEVTYTFEITREHPMVSLVGMIAPSPDWFYGVSGVKLLENGEWQSRVAVDVYAWDSGGDSGVTYMAEDMDLSTKKPTQYASTKHFQKSGKRVAVGEFVFKRIPASGK